MLKYWFFQHQAQPDKDFFERHNCGRILFILILILGFAAMIVAALIYMFLVGLLAIVLMGIPPPEGTYSQFFPLGLTTVLVGFTVFYYTNAEILLQ